MNLRVLVTGGFGYVGGRVAQALADAGADVVLGSRRQREAPDWLPTANCCATEWDSTDQLQQICNGIDVVIHLAAMNEIEAAKDPVGALQMNGVASVRLLESAIAAGVRRFIYFSTAHVYGAPLQGRLDETTLAKPIHPYATSHRAAEDVVLAARQQGRIEGVAVRLSNSFGPPTHAGIDRWTLLANDLCRQAAVEGTLTLRSAGLQRRDFVTLTDVGRATTHLVALPEKSLTDGLFNLGGDWAPTIFEVSELIAQQCVELGWESPQIQRPEPTGQEIERQSSEWLDYRIDKLKSTGFELAGDVKAELASALRFCEQVFRS